MRKHLARLLALVMVLNLVLCVPVSTGAAEVDDSSFEADPVILVTQTGAGENAPEARSAEDTNSGAEGGEKNVVVTETVPAETVGKAAVENQTVTVEVPLEDVLTQIPAGETEPVLSEDGTVIDYNAQIDGPEDTVPVSEALDLTVDVTDAETDQDGNLTDITYEMGLNQQTTVGGGDLGISMNAVDTVDPANVATEPVNADEFKVNLTVDGMTDAPTRVEHTDNGKTEYFYNEANGRDETDTGKKYFTVVTEAAKKVISLVTNFLGTFKVTSDAFENATTKKTFSNLEESISDAGNGQTVEMLGNYTANGTATISGTDEKSVTVDLNGHTYDCTIYKQQVIDVAGKDLDLTLQNGTLLNTRGGVVLISGSNNSVTIKNAQVSGGQSALKACSDENQLVVEKSTLTAKSSSGNAVCIEGSNNTATVKDSTVEAKSHSSSALKASGDGNQLTVENSTLSANQQNSNAVCIEGLNNTAMVNDSTLEAKKFGSSALKAGGDENNMTVDNSTITSAGNNSFGIQTEFSSTESRKGNTVTVQNSSTINAPNGVLLNGKGDQLTITDSTINGTDTGVTLSSKDTGGNYHADKVWNQKAEITSSVINVSDARGTAIFDHANQNTVTIQNSKVNSKGNFGITHNGSYGGANIQVIGSYINPDGTAALGIYISGSADNTELNNLTLKDTEVAGRGTAVEVKFTNVMVDGGKLVTLAESGAYRHFNSGNSTSGAALAVADNADPDIADGGPDAGKTGGTVVINSGYFKGAEDMYSVYWAVKEDTPDTDQAKITVNGGRYVYAGGLDKFTDENHGVMSYNDGHEYPYGVLGLTETPIREGYTFQGYTYNGKPITLSEAKAQKVVAVAQWEKTQEAADEEPAAVIPQKQLIIVQPDSNGNNVEVELQGSTAVITVTTPDGEEAAVSKVTITSVEELRELGVDTVQVQLEENVALELDVTPDNGMHGTVEITRTEDTLVISDGETEITIHMAELKEAADDVLHISLIHGVITISSGETVMFEVDVAELLKANGPLTVKLEDGILKIYDKNGTLLQEIKL